ncbi:MAG: DUF2892 domain-containing protein [Candidatus Kapabacteria bacterium]|nr:DUF2892 domain-containing protein [Ignavibacteriota bacterium]MCW5884516.1 DUF2892 domain-containing protein [Candidatus Kapabacteria bacterium]
MKKNVGKVDMIIRLVAGSAIAIWGIISGSWLGLIAIVPIATALTGFCPAFTLFGISTCKIKE